MFHNSPFSNFWPCGVQCTHRGVPLRFATSEALIMAFKQHLLKPTAGAAPHASLADAMSTHAAIQAPSENKEAAARATRRVTDYTWWTDHCVHLLVGATACLLKFSQDAGLRRLLLSTQGVLLVEAAPHDGAWGLARMCKSRCIPPHTAFHTTVPARSRAPSSPPLLPGVLRPTPKPQACRRRRGLDVYASTKRLVFTPTHKK